MIPLQVVAALGDDEKASALRVLELLGDDQKTHGEIAAGLGLPPDDQALAALLARLVRRRRLRLTGFGLYARSRPVVLAVEVEEGDGAVVRAFAEGLGGGAARLRRWPDPVAAERDPAEAARFEAEAALELLTALQGCLGRLAVFNLLAPPDPSLAESLGAARSAAAELRRALSRLPLPPDPELEGHGLG